MAAAWLLIQDAETLFPVFGLSDMAIRAVVIVLAIGFVPPAKFFMIPPNLTGAVKIR